MKILKNKQKSGFKGTIIKIGLAVLVAFMVFGAFKSCVKVNAETDSLDIGYSYYWDTSLVADWCKSLVITNNSYVYATSIRFFQYFDIEYDTIRVFRFFPELVHDEYRIIYYNSINGNSTTIYSCVFDRTDTNNVILLNYTWFGNPSIYITNNVITYSGLTQAKLFSVLSLGDYDLYQLAYNRGYDSGYSAGAHQEALGSYQRGRNEGYEEGRLAGINEGTQSVMNNLNNLPEVQSAISNARNEGYDLGFDDGVDSTNTYSFKTLFLSALEAPVTVIAGALNFDFLGYNLKDFVFSIFTIAIIAFIVKRLI